MDPPLYAADTSPLTIPLLLEKLKEVTDWYMLGAYLDVPVHELKKIEQSQNGVERCKLEVLQYWLANAKTPLWKKIVKALEQLNMVALARKLKSECLIDGECV